MGSVKILNMPKGIYKRKSITEEHRKHLSESHKGIKFSIERKANMNKDKIGKKRPPFSEEWRRKLGLANKGKKRTKEQIQKLIDFRLGKKLSKETKDKISKSHTGKHYEKHIANVVRGDKHPFWKGGITPIRFVIRNCFKYRQWISDIFTRDDYTCQHCLSRGNRLSAHHIKSFALILHENMIKSLEEAESCEELWNINNGITLCFSCHKLTDNYAKNLPQNTNLGLTMV